MALAQPRSTARSRDRSHPNRPAGARLQSAVRRAVRPELPPRDRTGGARPPRQSFADALAPAIAPGLVARSREETGTGSRRDGQSASLARWSLRAWMTSQDVLVADRPTRYPRVACRALAGRCEKTLQLLPAVLRD